MVSLPSELLKVVLSPQGDPDGSGYTLIVWPYWIQRPGEQLADLALEPSALADVVFLDEDRLVYAGENGICAYDAAAGRELWSGSPATNLVASGDGTRVAAVYKDAERGGRLRREHRAAWSKPFLSRGKTSRLR